MIEENSSLVNGKLIDSETRCAHYNSPLDIIAIKMKCCIQYYACIDCHNELETHEVIIWSKNEFDTKAILCGACKAELTINEYLACDNTCPNCKSLFNPKCSNHYHYYFDMQGSSKLLNSNLLNF